MKWCARIVGRTTGLLMTLPEDQIAFGSSCRYVRLREGEPERAALSWRRPDADDATVRLREAFDGREAKTRSRHGQAVGARVRFEDVRFEAARQTGPRVFDLDPRHRSSIDDAHDDAWVRA